MGPKGGQPVGRRAADAHAEPGADLQAQAAHDRRAEPRPRAAHRRAAARHRARDPRHRHDRSCWSSSPSTWPSRWPNAPSSWRRARSVSTVRPPTCWSVPTSCAPCSCRAPTPVAPRHDRRADKAPAKARKPFVAAVPDRAGTSTTKRCRSPRSACPSVASAPSTASSLVGAPRRSRRHHRSRTVRARRRCSTSCRASSRRPRAAST